MSDFNYWKSLVLKTRQYGHCYIHAAKRIDLRPIILNGICFYWGSFGRSIQGGGHKYKVRAMKDGKPVKTKDLQSMKERV